MGQKSSKLSRLSPQSMKDLKRFVDFSPDEIQNWYAEYQDSLAYNQSELTREEFKKVYNSLFMGDASSFAEHVFRTFDTDGSGTVNFKEFLIGLCISGNDKNTRRKLEWAFHMYDINGDGYISKSEMREIVEAIYKMTNALLPKDINTPKKMTDKFFNEFDSNQDGRISFVEFCNGAERDPVIVDLLQCNPDPEN